MLEGSRFWVGQGARVGWYLGQYLLARRMLTPASARARSARHPPTMQDLLIDLRGLLDRDWRNIRAGHYRLPDDLVADPVARIVDGIRYFRELPNVAARRKRDGTHEVRERLKDKARSYPEYYLRNFHYQTDGYLSDVSARLYDQQVEVLFFGSADAMRRQALVPLAEALKGRRSEAVRLLDAACGTGRFLEMVKTNHPRLDVTGLDLSPNYLDRARRRLRRFSRMRLVQGLAERLPLADAGVDVVTCVYLFHEVPDETRRAIAHEFARVLRPGGRAILVDSIQLGDRADYDPMLRGFPKSFHEPYYADYVASDLDAVFTDAGLRPARHERAFLSKVMVYDKP